MDAFERLKIEEIGARHEESKIPTTSPSIEKAPKLELKSLPPLLRYVILGKDEMLPVVIVTDLNGTKVERLEYVLKWFKRAIGWTIVDVIGIPPGILENSTHVRLQA